jgi:hypothetical protein
VVPFGVARKLPAEPPPKLVVLELSVTDERVRCELKLISRTPPKPSTDANRSFGGKNSAWFNAEPERKRWLKLDGDKMTCIACIRYRVGDPENQMPERKAIVLAKSNIKIAHKFSTGAPRRAALRAPLPRSHAARAGNSARPTARMVARQLQGQDAQRGGVQGAVELGSTEGLVYSQKLLPSDYGCDKMWVALKRDQQSAAAQRRVQQPSADQRAEGPAALPPRPDPTADVPPLPAPASRPAAAASSTALPRLPSNAHGAAAAAGLRHAAAAARGAQL